MGVYSPKQDPHLTSTLLFVSRTVRMRSENLKGPPSSLLHTHVRRADSFRTGAGSCLVSVRTYGPRTFSLPPDPSLPSRSIGPPSLCLEVTPDNPRTLPYDTLFSVLSFVPSGRGPGPRLWIFI